jgi:AraC-like DNA-binding protein
MNMLTSTGLAVRPHYAVHAVVCDGDHAGWSEAAASSAHRLVLVRRGRFRRRGAAGCAEIDRLCAYFAVPGEPEEYAHPAGGDVCSAITVDTELWRSLAGTDAVSGAAVAVDGRVDLAHRRCLAAARSGDPDFDLAEQLIGLLAVAVRRAIPGSLPDAAGRRDAAFVAAARETIRERDPAAAGLVPLAQRLGVSPFRLSRVFSREMGESITAYRNRFRIARALDALEAGEPSLAADLGFADQAHLTRTLRVQVGHPPAVVRTLLGPRP